MALLFTIRQLGARRQKYRPTAVPGNPDPREAAAGPTSMPANFTFLYSFFGLLVGKMATWHGQKKGTKFP